LLLYWLVLVDESGCCCYFQDCQTSWGPVQEHWKEPLGSSLAWTASERRQRTAAHSPTTVAMLDCFAAVTIIVTRLSRLSCRKPRRCPNKCLSDNKHIGLSTEAFYIPGDGDLNSE
jgi:hypothetical protein